MFKSAIFHRFLSAFVAGGSSTAVLVFSLNPSFSNVHEFNKFVITVIVAFIFGGIFALEKALVEYFQTKYPAETLVVAPVIQTATQNAEQAVEQKLDVQVPPTPPSIQV